MKRSNKILIAFIALAIILGGVYYAGQQQVKESIDLLEMEYTSFNVEGMSLLPLRIDLTITYTVLNPSDIPLKVSVDGVLLYGEVTVTPIRVEERLIQEP